MYKLRLAEFVFKCLKGYTVTKFKDLFLQRNSGRRRNEKIILPRPETNFIRNFIGCRGAISWNTLTNKETRAKTLKEFKRCLVKFNTDTRLQIIFFISRSFVRSETRPDLTRKQSGLTKKFQVKEQN